MAFLWPCRLVLLALLQIAASDPVMLLPVYIAPHMVLQQGAQVPIWGMVDPRAAVVIAVSSQTVHAVASDSGRWEATLPAFVASAVPMTIDIASSTGGHAVITDVVVGDVYFCSGQSNMQLSVCDTVNWEAEAAASNKYRDRLRISSVATTDADCNTTAPQDNTTMSIPWSRASVDTVGGMSAVCYYYAVRQLEARPNVPVGLVASSWGGTAIQPWMGPAALQKCNSTSVGDGGVRHDPGLAYLKGHVGSTAFPTMGSTLYNSMVAPFVRMPLRGWLWYQGEANVGQTKLYECLFPAMIEQWRSAWVEGTKAANDPLAPFLFVQLSGWPTGDQSFVWSMRFSQLEAVKLPNVGVAVSADIADPSSPFHPIHPPQKQEVARRLALAAESIVHGNKSVPAMGPVVTKIMLDKWDESWGNYHYGSGSFSVCASTGFSCLGIRLMFDQPIVLTPGYDQHYSIANGFTVRGANAGDYQGVTLTGIRSDDPTVVQLNVTFVVGGGIVARLDYALADYPVMPLFNIWGQPAMPFSLALGETELVV